VIIEPPPIRLAITKDTIGGFDSSHCSTAIYEKTMNRDPKNQECTRDPIFLLQVGNRQWTQIPDGMGYDGDSMWIETEDEVEDWIRPFLDKDGGVDFTDGFWREVEKREGDHGWPLVYIEWRTETVFLTREEAEAWAKRREYRWPMWKVYCIPCDGELAKILNAHEPAAMVG
jgi:hypothetical protein